MTLGRTELQEAVPLTLGAEFSGFAEAIERDRWRTFKCEERLRVVNIGGTAVGTGLSAPRSYIFLVIERLREVTGLGLARGENLVDQTANADCFVEVSGILKAHAASLMKICNDLRLLDLLGEIRLPALQAGSSIMPGKVNPVLLEAAIQAGMKVMANDTLIADACSRGSLQINEFLPLVSFCLHESLDLLTRIDDALPRTWRGSRRTRSAAARTSRGAHDRHGAPAPHRLRKGDGSGRGIRRLGQGEHRGFLSEKLGQELVEEVFSPQKLVALGIQGRSRHDKDTEIPSAAHRPFRPHERRQVQLPEHDRGPGRGHRLPGAGTTTDVVEKPMELLPLGPVVFLDTAGWTTARSWPSCGSKTRKIFDRSDVVVVILEPGIWTDYEEEILAEAAQREMPVILVVNKIDLETPSMSSSRC